MNEGNGRKREGDEKRQKKGEFLLFWSSQNVQVVVEEIFKWSCEKRFVKDEDGNYNKEILVKLKVLEEKTLFSSKKTIDKNLVKCISHNKLYNGRKET